MSTESINQSESDFKIALEDKAGLDRLLDRVSEMFSSILVKETRQALKSRQFLWTFFGLLVVVVLWVYGGLAYTGTDAGRDSLPGPYLLYGFWLILGFPLAIVIPFSTYRSLAQEYEDGSLQMVSITTLKPYQIIWGKLGSSMLQILVYVSVLAPCIAFTYLLRGIDIIQIWWGLVIASATSVALCVLSLFLASTAKSRHFGTFLTFVLLVGLAITYWLWGVFSYALTYESLSVLGMRDGQSEVMLGGYISFLGSTAFILFAAASAHVTFEADNRSTWIRIALFTQQVIFFGWIAGFMTTQFHKDMGYVFACVICHYWMVMGAMMCSVPAIMSRRVKRALPNTFLTRSAFSLFMPGPGRGYLFAVANMFGWCGLLFVLMLVADYVLPAVSSGDRNLSGRDIESMVLGFVTNLIYGIAFLSILFLTLDWSFKRRINAGPIFGGALAVFLLVASVGLPFLIHYQLFPLVRNEYMLIHTSNWYVTMGEIARYPNGVDSRAYVALMIMSGVLVVLGYLALRVACRELHFLPESIPNRVLEEDRLKRAERSQPKGETIDELLGFDQPDSQS